VKTGCEEALAKQEQLPELPVRWHLIGSLQRNKVRQVVGRFTLIHSIDRVELAESSTGGSPPARSKQCWSK
jgi:uncharacterized pyridoxal phosphate-containing UPF0001 family protein